MELSLDAQLAASYTSQSQRIRVMTEAWVGSSVYCPNCGHADVDKYPNNQPVADFNCPECTEQYELKSQKNHVGAKLVDGAYRTMIQRLRSSHNPNFFVLNYTLESLRVVNFFVIPKHFFIPQIIEERRPLSPTARRAGWIGCNILLSSIPQTGKIFFVRDGRVGEKSKILADWKKTLFLRDETEASAKGWLLDTMLCIEKIGKQEFTLDEVYAFEDELSKKHPDNRHVTDKLRQQLQVLRDRDYLEFTSRGKYKLR